MFNDFFSFPDRKTIKKAPKRKGFTQANLKRRKGLNLSSIIKLLECKEIQSNKQNLTNHADVFNCPFLET